MVTTFCSISTRSFDLLAWLSCSFDDTVLCFIRSWPPWISGLMVRRLINQLLVTSTDLMILLTWMKARSLFDIAYAYTSQRWRHGCQSWKYDAVSKIGYCISRRKLLPRHHVLSQLDWWVASEWVCRRLAYAVASASSWCVYITIEQSNLNKLV